MERSGIIASALAGEDNDVNRDDGNDDYDDDNETHGAGGGSHYGDESTGASRIDPHETEDEQVARLQRERLRVDRRMQRERELRRENMGPHPPSSPTAPSLTNTCTCCSV
jgi:hypothetical protein